MALVDIDISASFPEQSGLTWDDVTLLQSELAEIVEVVDSEWQSGLLPFLSLPDDITDRLSKMAEEARLRFDRLVVLGIGGSSLGARAVIQALTARRTGLATDGTERRSVWFNENVDPDDFQDMLDAVDWDHTQWNVVTKSGSTIETLSGYLVVRQELEKRFGEQGARERLVVTTDAERGPLRSLAKENEYTSLEVPRGVGGRYSVLSAVGLYPSAFAGIDVKAMLSGAAQARDRCLSRDVLDNPAAVLAALQVLHYRAGRPIVVFMPYATALVGLSEWFCQLWAESLGKRRGDELVGPTPVRALGVTDQHSQLQLYMEGPKDKNIIFLEVKEFRNSVNVPISKGVPGSIAHLCGKDLGEILRAELAGTQQALSEEGCPSSLLRLRTLSAESLGALLMLLEIATALAGGLLSVDPFNQPGVELGKRYAHGLLGRAKEAHYAAALTSSLAKRKKRILTI